MVPLKVVVGLGKIDFWHFSASKQVSDHQVGLRWAFLICLNAQKSIFSNPMATFNGTTVKLRSKAKKTVETPI